MSHTFDVLAKAVQEVHWSFDIENIVNFIFKNAVWNSGKKNYSHYIEFHDNFCSQPIYWNRCGDFCAINFVATCPVRVIVETRFEIKANVAELNQ